METRCDVSLAAGYKSASQITRRITEAWGAENLYCAACPSPRVSATKANTGACDFVCARCAQRYELKSMKTWSERRVNDSAYSSMIRAIRSDATPNLLLLQYSLEWDIEKLLLIPRFFFSESIIEKRKPLSATAEQAGWTGCNILIGLIPAEGKIPLIEERSCVSPREVRARYEKVAGLQKVPPGLRGWALDVFRCVKRLPKRFHLTDVYAFKDELASLHPGNRFVQDKVRQQLQVLRDAGLVRFLGHGNYQSLT